MKADAAEKKPIKKGAGAADAKVARAKLAGLMADLKKSAAHEKGR